jgi:hypothetical protein
MLQTLDAIPEIFAMMVLSWDRNDIFYWIEARSPENWKRYALRIAIDKIMNKSVEWLEELNVCKKVTKRLELIHHNTDTAPGGIPAIA